MSREQMAKAVVMGAPKILRARLEGQSSTLTKEAPKTEPPIVVGLGELRRAISRLEEIVPMVAQRVAIVTSRADEGTPAEKSFLGAAGGSSPLLIEVLGMAERLDMVGDSLLRLTQQVEL
jgi:hypothetical protein